MLDKQALWGPKTLGFGIASLGRIEYIISRVSIDFGGMNPSSRAGIADMMKVSFLGKIAIFANMLVMEYVIFGIETYLKRTI